MQKSRNHEVQLFRAQCLPEPVLRAELDSFSTRVEEPVLKRGSFCCWGEQTRAQSAHREDGDIGDANYLHTAPPITYTQVMFGAAVFSGKPPLFKTPPP